MLSFQQKHSTSNVNLGIHEAHSKIFLFSFRKDSKMTTAGYLHGKFADLRNEFIAVISPAFGRRPNVLLLKTARRILEDLQGTEENDLKGVSRWLYNEYGKSFEDFLNYLLYLEDGKAKMKEAIDKLMKSTHCLERELVEKMEGG